MKIIIFGGTTEGRILAYKLVGLGASVTVSVATAIGAEELADIGNIDIIVGRKKQSEITELVSDFDLCIDATHPYAVEVTANIKNACTDAGVALRRLLRQKSKTDDIICVSDCEAAAEFLAKTTGNILITTGAKELPKFGKLPKERLFARVLPTDESIYVCEALGLYHKNILALQGPFTLKMNEAMLEQYHIKWLVTKDGGTVGGFEEKILAAQNLRVSIILVSRPMESGETEEEIYESIKETLRCL